MTDKLRRYSKKKVNEAGLILRDAETLTKEVSEAINVVSDWRASHAVPLEEAYAELTSRAKSIDPKNITSQRHKRLISVIFKLWRYRDMKLTTMQDIGGCRAVLSDMSMVRELALPYGDPVRDYIKNPKEDGYRSLHFVEQYQPEKQQI